jgi:arsenate reductase
MAEALLRAIVGDRAEVASAGTTARGVHPLAVRVMAEVGVDISAQRSKTVEEVRGDFDVVVTVCDTSCPIPPRHRLLLRWKFPDPSAAGGGEEERLGAFRRVRDGIAPRVRALARRLERLGPDNARPAAELP